MVTAALNLGLLAAFVFTVARDPRLDLVSLVLPGICVVALAVREIVLSRQNAALLGRLGELAYRDALTGLANRRALLERLRAHDPRREAWLLDPRPRQLQGRQRPARPRRGGRAADPRRGADRRRLRSGRRGVPAGRGRVRPAQRRPPRRRRGPGPRGLRSGARRGPRGARGRPGRAVRLAPVSPGCPSTGTRDPLRVLAESATALQAAKAAGRRRCVVYEGAVAAAAERRRLLEARLRDALATGSLRVHAAAARPPGRRPGRPAWRCSPGGPTRCSAWCAPTSSSRSRRRPR